MALSNNGDRPMRWKLILVLVFLILLIIFTVQNYEVISIQFFLWSFQTSRTIVILATFVIGVLVGLIISFRRKK